ncbi:glycosyltransferase family 39 protein [Stenotrophomonas maltophilia]|uniref:glycosyltransferase family 39 protein n=1 Tax=Stenotrophomonas maltophilia TaxID=40324 RepID=UPI0013DA8731|nr:glycosyltransferase family 39 protein [Stenotrophomonas maltophilia]
MKRTALPGQILLACSTVLLVWATWYSWSMPIVDAFGFRQAQTALSTEWLARGGPFFNYVTPVTGAPWSIPFEFPLFQGLSALISAVTGLGTDRSGRLVSVFFQVASIWMLYRIVLEVRAERALATCVAGAFAVSPLALFWARSVMIESTAVFLGLLFVWAICRVWRGGGHRYGLLAVLAATLAALVKVTTFYGFAVFVALAFAWVVLREQGWRRAWISAHARLLGWGAASAVAALVVLVAWLDHADAMKSQTPLGASLTSAALGNWNYGTFAQRLDPAVWKKVFVDKRFADLFGSTYMFLIVVLLGLVVPRTRVAVGLLLAAYIIPFMTFTNLHFVHDYYQTANQVFATSIVGLLLWWLGASVADRRGVMLGSAAALGLSALSIWYLHGHFLPMMQGAFQPSRFSEVARVVKENTSNDDVIIVFGMDWSSEMPYLASRRAVMVPDWAPLEHYVSIAKPDSALLGGGRMGAVVDCPNQLAGSGEREGYYRQILKEYAEGGRELPAADCRVIVPR